MPACRICSAQGESQSIRAEYVFGGKEEHNFWQCEKCDAIYLFPPISEEEEKYFYKMEFEKFMTSRSQGERDWGNAEAHIQTNQDQVKRRWKFLEPHIKPGMDLLEIGCSSGFMMNALRDFGMNCIGIEPSGEFTEFLQKNKHTAYGSMEEFRSKEPRKQFDLIVHFFVFEHIRDPYSFLQESLDLLKPGGKIIAEIPSATDPLTSLYDIPAFEKFYWSIAHHYYYTPKSLAYVLDQLDCQYELLPEQRYDLSNHITWMTKGKPGGQGKYGDVFRESTLSQYHEDLKEKWLCDTVFAIVKNSEA